MKMGVPTLKLKNTKENTKNGAPMAPIIQEMLSERYGSDPDIDRSRSGENRYFGATTFDEVWRLQKEWQDQYIASGHKIRSDAVLLYAGIFKPEMGFFDGWARPDIEVFFKRTIALLKERVGAENLVCYTFHFDEVNPHCHFVCRPVTPDGRLSAKEVLNLKLFGFLNNELPTKLNELYGYDLEPLGSFNAQEYKTLTDEEKDEYIKAKKVKKEHGKSSKTYKAEKLNQEIKKLDGELQVRVADVLDLDSDIYHKKNEINNLDAQLNSMTDLLHHNREVFNVARDSLITKTTKLKDELKQTESELEKTKSENSTLKQTNELLRRERSELESEVTDLRHQHSELTNQIKEKENKLEWLTEKVKDLTFPIRTILIHFVSLLIKMKVIDKEAALWLTDRDRLPLIEQDLSNSLQNRSSKAILDDLQGRKPSDWTL